MNHIYRLVWNASRRTWAVASELTPARGKRSHSTRTARKVSAVGGLLFGMAAAGVFAGDLPAGGHIAAGQGAIEQVGNALNVTQNSDNLVLNWSEFNIGADNAVNFVQPSSSALALNRVLGADPSQIQGQLNANGQVWLINPNGVLIGNDAQVNVGGFVASTLDLSDEDFLAGNYVLDAGGSNASIVNLGEVNAHDGGYVALLGAQVSNQGVLRARLGTVAIGAGERVSLDFAGDSLLFISVEEGALGALAENHQLILADGGQVLMSASAAGAVLDTVINNTGVIEARTIGYENGAILLRGDYGGGTVQVGGTLDASAPNGGHGGFIETSGAHVQVAGDVTVTTHAPQDANGAWLIAPSDVTVAAEGGNITGVTLSETLTRSDVRLIALDGSANVNDTVSWSENTLTLYAGQDIHINAPLNGSGTAGLILQYGHASMEAGNTARYYVNAPVNLASTGSFRTRLGRDGDVHDWTIITSLGEEGSLTGSDLQGMNGRLDGWYVLGSDIDATATASWLGGFSPVGPTSLSPFRGRLDGLGHVIEGLTINRLDGAALFGVAEGAAIRNVGLVDAAVSGMNFTSTLVGILELNSLVSDSFATGTVSALNFGGGLVGFSHGAVTNSYADVAVGGMEWLGGLIGGQGEAGSVHNSYAAGDVIGSYDLGGLLGLSAGAITNSYASGAVHGQFLIGGLVGQNLGSVTDTYASGLVSGGVMDVGGLIGHQHPQGSVDRSFWNVESVGVLHGIAVNQGTGEPAPLSSLQMTQQASFAAWDISAVGGSSAVWRIYEGQSMPLLRSFLTPLTVTVNDASKVYDALSYAGGNGARFSGFRAGESVEDLLGQLTYAGSAQGARNAGQYTLTGAGLYSGQQGYDISYADGTLWISRALLNVAGAIAQDRVYDGTTAVAIAGATLDGVIGEDSVILTDADHGHFSDKNVGTDKAVSTSMSLGGADAANYELVQPIGLTADVSQAALTVTGAKAQDRAYDGTTQVAIDGATLGGVIGSDEVLLANAAAGTVADKNAGTGKAVSTAMGLTGADAGNYLLLQPIDLTVDIRRAVLSVINAVAKDRVYDGTTIAAIHGAELSGALGSDAVVLTNATVGSFADKNAGTDKAVTTAMGLAGTDAANYELVQPLNLAADVSARMLSISAAGLDKPADGTTAAAVILSDDRIAGDDLTVTYGEARFNDAEVGADKPIHVTGIDVSGADASNYVWDSGASAFASVTPASTPVDPPEPPVDQPQPPVDEPEPSMQRPRLALSLDTLLPTSKRGAGAASVDDSPEELRLTNRGIRLPKGVASEEAPR